MMSNLHDDRKLPIIFIHACLDDFGLDPYQYRIYARIARRAGKKECFESVASMAKGCKMGTGTVKRALKYLVDHRFVTRHSHLGQPSSYKLTDPDLWIPSPQTTQDNKPTNPGPQATQPTGDPGTQRSGGGSEATQGVDLCDPGGGPETTHKVDPIKYIPLSESNKNAPKPFLDDRAHSDPDPESAREKPIRKIPTAVEQSESRFTAQELPKWRTGTGPNDWNESAVDAVLGWLNGIRRAKGEPDAKRADAIAYIARREYPGHSDYPALVARIDELLAAGAEKPARSWRQRLREEKLAKENHAT